MPRQGLNATLAYNRAGTLRTYRVRAGMLAHGVQMISAESVARTQRAYYPHRTAMQQFTVEVLLKDWAERTHFTRWLATYAEYAIDPNIIEAEFPWMTVSVPLREFLYHGVPLQGYEWGAHTGQMMFTPQIVFEAATSPGQKNRPNVSTVINKWAAFSQDKAIKFFYPIGAQLAGDQAPVTYAKIVYPGDPASFNSSSFSSPGPPGSAAPAAEGPGLAIPAVDSGVLVASPQFAPPSPPAPVMPGPPAPAQIPEQLLLPAPPPPPAPPSPPSPSITWLADEAGHSLEDELDGFIQ